ncbi:MAG: hypothetical protein ABIF82_14415 [Planctomycetota bacterium]
MEFFPGRRDYYDGCTANVTVEAGKTATVTATLPWRKGSPWSAWSAGTLVGKDYAARSPCLQTIDDAPAIVADDGAVRVFWSREGDLWCATSTDGQTFSPPAKIPIPVSSGWIEQDPLCLHDESGRFLLVFRSDREGQHRMRAYVCWSRNARNWSRPSMVVDRPVGQFHMIQDRRGRYIWADSTGATVTVLVSRDAYRWETSAKLPLAGDAASVCILQRADGKYELMAESIRYPSKHKDVEWARTAALRWLSSDAAKWSAPETITELPFRNYGYLCATHVDRSTVLFYFGSNPFGGAGNILRMFREKPGGGWRAGPGQEWLLTTYGTMTSHPKWGYMTAWSVPPNMQFAVPGKGPYFMRGKSVDQFLEEP